MQSLHLAANIKTVNWAPQNNVLGHPAVKAFVTHAGSNGLYEAAYHGVPVVSIPLMNEQPGNAAKVSSAVSNLPPKLAAYKQQCSALLHARIRCYDMAWQSQYSGINSHSSEGPAAMLIIVSQSSVGAFRQNITALV